MITSRLSAATNFAARIPVWKTAGVLLLCAVDFLSFFYGTTLVCSIFLPLDNWTAFPGG